MTIERNSSRFRKVGFDEILFRTVSTRKFVRPIAVTSEYSRRDSVYRSSQICGDSKGAESNTNEPSDLLDLTSVDETLLARLSQPFCGTWVSL